MENSFNILTVVLLIGAVQGVFLSFFVLSQKSKSRPLPSIILSILMFIGSSLLFYAAMFVQKEVEILIIITPVLFPLFLVLGPLIFIYTQSLLNARFKLKPAHLLHLLPALIAFIFFISKIIFMPIEIRMSFNEFMQDKIPLAERYFRIADFLSRFIYTLLSIYLLYNYKKQLKEQFSLIEKFDFAWLRNILILASFTLLIYLIIIILQLGNNPRLYVGVLFAGLTYIVGYIYVKNKSGLNNAETADAVRTKYERSGLSQEKKNEIYSGLMNLMKNEKPYLDSDITAKTLADKMNVTQNHLSQVLNEVIGKNFYEFINYHRIEEAKKFLSDPSVELSILAIAFEVGFQSKTTFNTVFKKLEKQTPSQYRAKYLK